MRFFRLALGLVLTLPVMAATPEKPATTDDLYDLGKNLFNDYAPDEVKQNWEFPDRRQWDEFAARLQHALEDNRLEGLAAYTDDARHALQAARMIPGYEVYADWLAERLDYAEAAAQVTREPLPRPTPEHVESSVPYYNFWLGRVRARSIPPGAAELVPQLREAFVAEGLPPGLVWLAEVESTFNPEACSPAGARGLFQLMPATAKELGLSTALPDERADPEKSARAAAHYLKQMYDQFGDWPLALAAYNAGPGRVRRTLAAAGTDSFAAIAGNLPAETRMYVPKVLATVEVRSGHALAARVLTDHEPRELVAALAGANLNPVPLQ
jgi:membrane-bound lytic murein transglycosylase D